MQNEGPDSARKRRNTFVDMLRRRARAGRGSSLELLRSRDPHPLPDLGRVLKGVAYVVAGGAATSLYMARRSTDNVDVLIASSQGSVAVEALMQGGAEQLGAFGRSGSSWRLPDGTLLHLLVCHEPWVEDALAQPVRHPSGEPVIALPYLVLMKLAASRGVDIGDLARMLGGAGDAKLDVVREIAGRYMPEAIGNLETLVEVGRLEFE